MVDPGVLLLADIAVVFDEAATVAEGEAPDGAFTVGVAAGAVVVAAAQGAFPQCRVVPLPVARAGPRPATLAAVFAA